MCVIVDFGKLHIQYTVVKSNKNHIKKQISFDDSKLKQMKFYKCHKLFKLNCLHKKLTDCFKHIFHLMKAQNFTLTKCYSGIRLYFNVCIKKSHDSRFHLQQCNKFELYERQLTSPKTVITFTK